MNPGSLLCSQEQSCAKIHGLSRAPRPMATPAQPVSLNMPGVGDGAHIAVAEDRHPLDRFNHGANPGDIDLARKTLFARAAMDHNGSDAGALELAGQFRRREIELVPAEPHLYGDGNAHGLDDGVNE